MKPKISAKGFTIFFFLFLTTSLIAAVINKDIPAQNEAKPDRTESSSSMMIPNLKSGQEDYGNAPYWNRVEQFGGSPNDYLQDGTTDSDGNVYVTGYFSGAVSIGDKNLVSNGNRDAIVAKFNKSGELQWLTQLVTLPEQETGSYEICVGPDHSVYITGYYIGAVIIGGTIMPDNNWYNLFMAKLDPDGRIEMVKGHPTAESVEVGFDIDLDELGNIYVLAMLDNNIRNFRSQSVLVKYSPSGDIIWEQQHDERFSALDVVNSSVYLAGNVPSVNDGSVDGVLNSGVTVDLPWGFDDAFLAKSDLSGNFQWASTAQHMDTTQGDSYSTHLLVDNTENIYMAGVYRTEITFGLSSLTPTTSQGDFIAACSPEGQFQWGISFDEPLGGIAIDVAGAPLVAEEDLLHRISPDSMISTVVDTLPFIPNAISTCIDITTPANNARYGIGRQGVNMAISKRDQNFKADWLLEFEGNSGTGKVRGMVADDNGNLYTYGVTTGKVEYSGKKLQGAMFISKQNSSGDIIWLKEISLGFSDPGNVVDDLLAIDPSFQNIYFAGSFWDPINIGGDTLLNPSSAENVFVAEYGTDGSFHWVYQGNFLGELFALAPDHSGNVIFSGIFYDSIDIGSSRLFSAGSYDVFITKLNESGNPAWAKRAGGESMEYLGVVSTDSQDNIYLTGEFTSVDVTVDDTPITMNQGDGNILFSKLDKDGNVLWVDSKAGSNIPFEDENCWPTGMVTDPDGNSYIKGWHGDSVYFDTVLLTSPHGVHSYFVAKFDANGNTLWANSIQEKEFGWDYGQMDIDDAGSVYLGAQAMDTLWFGSDYVYERSGGIDLFMAKYDSAGMLDWVKPVSGSTKAGSLAYIESVAVSDSSRIYVGGEMYDYLEFDNIEIKSGNVHGFVAMLTGASLPGISFTKKDVTKAGGNDGSIDLTTIGGVPPFSYIWNNGAVSEDIGTLVAGDYKVNLTDAGDNKISKTIRIAEPLDTICNITANFDYNASDMLVSFSNLTTGVNNTYSWSFGDGNLSNLVNPSHVYVNPGIYDICLTVYDSFTGCMKEMCRTIQVGSVICYADFEFYHNADTQGLVHFTSSVGGPVESYYWMFGDGFFSTDPDPSHKFDLPGYYEVSLTVTDSTGNCMDKALESIQVEGTECNADFSYYIDSETNTAYFTSKDQNDNRVYNWIFGDGSQSTLKSPEHTFKYPGFYSISLSVYDNVSGCLDDKEKTIQVGKGGDIEADFIYQTQSVGMGVRFQDQSLGENLTYLWDFGDRNTSTKPNPVHNYEQGGNYYVCLNVYSASGMQNITCKPIFVGLSADQECQARFAYLVDNASWTVKYTDKSFGSPDTWSWDFGDETAATVKYPEHTYAEADYYTVHLKIQNSVSKCLDHAFKLVNVDREGGLIAGFGYVIHTQVKKADSYPVDFIGVSLGDAGKLKWSFGDGGIDTTSMTPSHDFESGTYKVCLTLSDPNTKESDTICKMIQVSTSNIGYTEPEGMELICYPNPFMEHTTVLFKLSDQTWVDLSMYDMMGRKVKQLIREERNPGRHQFELKGLELESGHYYLILLTPDAVERTVITIVK